MTSVWNRIGAAPVERGGPVQAGLIHFSSFSLIINVIQHQVSNAKSRIDHRPSYVGSSSSISILYRWCLVPCWVQILSLSISQVEKSQVRIEWKVNNLCGKNRSLQQDGGDILNKIVSFWERQLREWWLKDESNLKSDNFVQHNNIVCIPEFFNIFWCVFLYSLDFTDNYWQHEVLATVSTVALYFRATNLTIY